jgi:hypothetical protein
MGMDPLVLKVSLLTNYPDRLLTSFSVSIIQNYREADHYLLHTNPQQPTVILSIIHSLIICVLA